MEKDLLSLIGNFATLIVVASPAIFIFGVTLLGTAIERAQQEEKIARENDAQHNKDEIEKVEEALAQAKVDGNTSELTQTLDTLRKTSKKIEGQIESIKRKYSRINLHNSVIQPCLAAFLSFILTPYVALYSEQQKILSGLIITFQFGLIFFGLKKILNSLVVIQEISAAKKESETFDRLGEVIKAALLEHDQSKEAETKLTVVDKQFPLNTTTDTELKIKVRVSLTKGSVLHNASIWFYVPEGIGLVSPSENESWRQGADFNPPNIRTVKVDLGTLSKGPYTPRIITIKTPTTPGKYILDGRVFGDGYSGQKHSFVLLVA